MAKNTKRASRKTSNRAFALLALLFVIISNQSFAYTDQIVAETPSMVKTVYDVRVHSFIRHLYDDKKIVDTSTPDWMKTFEDERTNFIQQYLAQNYVNENALNLKPTPSETKQATKIINDVFKDEATKVAAFAKLNMTDNDIQQWIASRLIFEKFVTNTIQNRVIITDDKVNTHYQTWKGERFSNKPLEQVQQKVRDDLTQTLLKEEFDKWIDQEKRREKMILKVVSSS